MVSFNRFTKSARRGLKLLGEGHIQTFGNAFRERLYNEYTTLGLRRDLDTPFKASEADIDISVRPFQSGDLDFLLEHAGVAENKPRFAEAKQELAQAGIPKCYVAVTNADTPCFVQWVFRSSQNEQLQNFYDGLFPRLHQKEALLEGAYMHRDFRGMNIMSAAINKILEIERRAGLKQAITFVDLQNIPSLKGLRSSGFSPYVTRKVRWLLFRRKVSYHALTADIMEKYELNTTTA